MKIISFEQFTNDYNKKHNTDFEVIYTNTHELESIIDSIYDNDDFEIDVDEELIYLY